MDERIPGNEAHRRAWIKYQLELRGISIAQIARDNGVTRQCVNAALVSRYPKAERLIADALDRRPEELWPERYQVPRGAGE